MGVGYSLNNLGMAALQRGQYDRAAALCKEGLDILQTTGEEHAVAEVHISLGMIADARGDQVGAEAWFVDALRMMQVKEPRVGPMGAAALEGMAGVAGAQGHAERATRLFGAARALRTKIGAPLWPANGAWYEQRVTAARTDLGDDAWRAAWEKGEALTPKQVFDYALDGVALP